MPRRGLDTAQVLGTALTLSDEGLDSVTFARLAELLGVRAPSLYNHVAGRDALLAMITQRALEELADAIADAAAGRSGKDALRATAHAYRAYAHAHPGRYEATLAARRDDEDPELLAAAARLLELIGAILRGWRLEGEDAIDAIRTVRSAFHGFVTLERAGGFAMPRDLDASYERLIDVLATGLSSS